MTPTDRDALIERVSADMASCVDASYDTIPVDRADLAALISLASPSPAQWPEDVVERAADDETAWLIEEVWSGHLHFVHRDFDALSWFRETKRVHDIHRRKEQFITKEPSLAMRFTTKAEAEEWLGKQPLWMGTGQYEVREHMWPVAALATLPPPAEGVTMPQNADQAAMMALLGEKWLREHAPERLLPPPEDERGKGLIEARRAAFEFMRGEGFSGGWDNAGLVDAILAALASYRGGA